MSYFFHRRPRNWEVHLGNVIRRDSVLPEAVSKILQSNDCLFDVALKLLHYGPDCSYVIRPGQVLDVKTFSDSTKMKEVYICTKALLKLQREDHVKSYLIKKIVHTSTMKSYILRRDVSLSECLLAVFGHQEVQSRLRGKKPGRLGYHFWEKKIASQDFDTIPLYQ